MSERIQTVKVSIEVETNKRTIETHLSMCEGETDEEFTERVRIAIEDSLEIA